MEKAIRDPQWAAQQLVEHGHLQQRIYRALAKDPKMETAALAHVPDDLKSVVQRNVMATREIAGTLKKLRTDLPDWRIVEAAPADELLGYYKEAEAEHGVPWTVLASIHLVETRMGRLRGTSYAGASGPMQFMPKTWAAYGSGDINSNHDAIMSAGNYLKKMGAAKNIDKAIWHYNHSDHYVKSVKTYASILDEDPNAFRGFHGWHVYYRTNKGSIWLAPGYEEEKRLAVDTYCKRKGGEPYCPSNP